MTASELREAASLMRERAEAARAGRWFADGDEVWADWEFEDRQVARCEGSASEGNVLNATHVASWHPLVALAVADWLNDVADRSAANPQWYAVDHAVAVARAYLGGVS